MEKLFSLIFFNLFLEIAIKDFSVQFAFPASLVPKCKLELATKGKKIEKK